MLEGAEARNGIEGAHALARHLPRVEKVDVEAVAAARRQLRRGQGRPHAHAAALTDVVEQRPPAAPQIEDAPTRADSDLLCHVLVLASLSLLEAEREVAVVLRSAEVRQVSQAEPNDAVGQRIGEVDVPPVSHSPGVPEGRSRADRGSRPTA